jgi:hypothetical protein
VAEDLAAAEDSGAEGKVAAEDSGAEEKVGMEEVTAAAGAPEATVEEALNRW